MFLFFQCGHPPEEKAFTQTEVLLSSDCLEEIEDLAKDWKFQFETDSSKWKVILVNAGNTKPLEAAESQNEIRICNLENIALDPTW